MKDLSIILPTYNRLPYLKVALNNIVTEFDGINYELIIAVAGEDGSREYLQQHYKNYPQLRVVEDHIKEGNYIAISQCLDSVSGRFIMIGVDHYLHFGQAFPGLIDCLSSSDLKAIFLKYYRSGHVAPYRIFGGRRAKTYQGNWCPKLLVLPENAIFDRPTFVRIFRNLEGRFRNYGWATYLTYQLLNEGEKIGHARRYTSIEIAISDAGDSPHERREVGRSAMEEMDEVYREFRDLGQRLYRCLPTITRYRVRFFQTLIGWSVRWLNGNSLGKCMTSLGTEQAPTKIDRLVRWPADPSEPESYTRARRPDGSIDKRLFPKFLERAFDLIYPLSSACCIKESSCTDEVFLVQQLPTDVSGEN